MSELNEKDNESPLFIFIIFLCIGVSFSITFANNFQRDFYYIYLAHYYQFNFTSIYRIIPNYLLLFMTNFLRLDGNLALIIFNTIFLSLTSIVFYKYLRLFFSKEYSMIGLFFFFTCFPILCYEFVLAYYDALIYLVILLGFYALETKNEKWFIIISFLGMFIKETVLLVPFCYLFTYKDRHYKWRIIISASIAASYIAERFVINLFFSSSSSFLLGALTFISTLLLVNCMFVALAPLAFNGFFFVFAILQCFSENKMEDDEFLVKNLLPALIFIFATTFLLGRFNELRLIFIGFPLVIPLALRFVQEKFIGSKG